MKRSNLRHRARLNLEQLECRWVPALVIDNSNGVLNVSGDPVGTLTLTQTAQGVWSVNDNGNDLATLVSANGGVRVTLQGDDDTLVLNNGGAFAITGNVFIDVGNGDDTVIIENAGSTMTIAGLLQINTGSGDDAVTIANGGAVTVQGSAFVNMGSGTADSLDLGNTSPAVIQGDMVATDANIVSLNVGSQVLGKLTVQWSEVGTTANTLNFDATSLVGSLNVVGSAGGDSVTLDGTVQTTATVYLGNGTNMFTTNAGSTIGGSLSYNGGSGDDTVSLSSNVSGSATINLGASVGGVGAQTFTLASGGRLRGTTNLSAAGGITGMTFAAGSRTDGSLYVTTNGTTNTFAMNGDMFGSTFSYTGGAGVDTVTWAATAGAARFSVNLGAGNDVFNLNSSFYSGGTIDGGTGTDDFNNTAPIVNLIIRNFEM